MIAFCALLAAWLRHPRSPFVPLAFFVQVTGLAKPPAPTALPPPKVALPVFNSSREITAEEIAAVPAQFAFAAATAERCGFGGVQIHAAHGYLLAQVCACVHVCTCVYTCPCVYKPSCLPRDSPALHPTPLPVSVPSD